jgi:hypothetical protein
LTLFDHKDYKNIGRTPVHLVSIGVNGRNYMHAVGGGGPMIFISIIRVHACNIFEPLLSQGVGKPLRSVQGAMIEGEWERAIGSIGMIINEKEFRAPLFRDDLSFTTAFGSNESGMCSHFKLHLDIELQFSL